MTSDLPPRPHLWVPGKPESHQSCSGNSRSVWSLCGAFLGSSLPPETASTRVPSTPSSPNNGWKLPAPISCRALTPACASQGLSLDFSFELCKRRERGETFQASERGQGRCVQAQVATRACWLADVTCHMCARGLASAEMSPLAQTHIRQTAPARLSSCTHNLESSYHFALSPTPLICLPLPSTPHPVCSGCPSLHRRVG